MKLYTDFHIHSHYSIATSKLLIPEMLEIYALIKGLKIIATGDILHPVYLNELEKKLNYEGNGLYTLKKEYSFLYNNNFEKFLKENSFRIDKFKNIINFINYIKYLKSNQDLLDENKKHFIDKIYFILSGEISSIYKKKGKVRKNHNIIITKNFKNIKKIQDKIEKLGGNLKSDGRPIVGLDSKILLDITYSVDKDNLFIPAHIWTPWFSMLGSKSGFDSVKEAFEEFEDKIYAIETGLSSDPEMNFLCSFLDDKILLSNSDAHSPDKLGRNTNIFNIQENEISYLKIVNSIKNKDFNVFKGTVDTFPQLGKYYYDGHRKCGFKVDPVISKNKYNDICPVCQRRVTKGVYSRVIKLSDRDIPEKRPVIQKYYHIVTLKEIIAKTISKGISSKIVDDIYFFFILMFGNELSILIDYDFINDYDNDKNKYIKVDYEKKINKNAINNNYNIDIIKTYEKNKDNIIKIIENILKIRKGKIILTEGFDGQFGEINF